MLITQYGIQLRRVEHSDIELIRQKRNLPEIRSTMQFRKTISPSMQEAWFKSINNSYNYYYLIIHDKKPIGVINSKNINLEGGYGEGGIFVWENSPSMEFAPVFASLCLLNTVFDVLQIFNKSFVKINCNNHRAIAFNKTLGHVLLPGQERLRFQYYVLTKEDYRVKSTPLIRLAEKLTGDLLPPRVEGKPELRTLPVINKKIADLNGIHYDMQ